MYGKSGQQRVNAFTLCFLIILKLTKALDSEYSIPDDICSNEDSCSKHIFFTTCSCDDDCSKYGICCQDMPERDAYPLEQFECYSKNVSKAVYVKQSCNPSFAEDHDVITSCETDQQDWSDLMANILVSSNRTRITYKNWNCAICNKENVRDLWFWTLQVSYPADIVKNRLSYRAFQQHFVFDSSSKQWGVYDDDKFIKCPLKFDPPSPLGELRYCAENLTSNCPPSWKDESVRQKCHSYYAERKYKETYFKNAHCALCNGLAIEDLDCSTRNYNSESLPSGMAIKVIFNLNTWADKHAESHVKCLLDFKYDPFLKTCRRISCGLKHPNKINNHCEASGSSAPNTHYIIYILFAIFNLMVAT